MEGDKYRKHQPMVTKLLTRKCRDYCDDNEHEYFHLKDHESYVPTEEDIPSLVESIKFWQKQRPTGESKRWTPLKWQLYYQIKQKELICCAMLGKIPGMWPTVLKHMK